MSRKPYEYGITRTVRTFFSKYTTSDIVRKISAKKTGAVIHWMDENDFRPESTLIIGGYLTGVSLAGSLIKDSQVTVLDIHPEIRTILDPSVSFIDRIDDAGKTRFDMIVDTTGFGGIEPGDLSGLKRPGAFLVEDPCSEGSDESLRRINRTDHMLEKTGAEMKGILQTGGLNSKTSGTMTLTVEVLRNSIDDAVKTEGVLYGTANMEFFERILLDADTGGG